MPEFANAFSGLAAGRKVTHEELVRAIRYMIAAEYEAVQLYMQLAESTDNQLARVVLKDIADEEIVHAGEFLTLLKELAPSEMAFYAEGEREVREMMEEIAGGSSAEPETTLENVSESPPAREAEPSPSTVGNLFHHE